MSKESACSNKHNCTCPYTDCENHGRCCDCVVHHRDHVGGVPNCFSVKSEN